MELNITFLVYDLPFITSEMIQRLLDNKDVRKNLKVWCLILDEKLKRNEI